MHSNMTSVNQPLALPEHLLALMPTTDHYDTQSLLTQIQSSLPTSIFNHSLRVFFLGTQILQMQSEPGTVEWTTTSKIFRQYTIKPHLLFAASLFHDIGTCPSCNGPQRFEVEGADEAVRYLRSVNFVDETSLHNVWCAIALHTSAGIAERIDPLTWLVRMAVKADFAPTVRDSLGLADFATEIEKYLPRMEVEQRLAEAVVSQATRGEKDEGLYAVDADGKWTDHAKFPKATWPGVLLRGHLEKVRDDGENWSGPNPAF